jgi:hypothetical protein
MRKDSIYIVTKEGPLTMSGYSFKIKTVPLFAYRDEKQWHVVERSTGRRVSAGHFATRKASVEFVSLRWDSWSEKVCQEKLAEVTSHYDKINH